MSASAAAFSSASSAAADSSAKATTSAAFGGAGALRAPFVVASDEESAAGDDFNEKAAADADKEAALLGLLFCSLLVGVVGSLLVSACPPGPKSGNWVRENGDGGLSQDPVAK